LEQDELLRFTVAALERIGVAYLVTGSVATIFFGEPRFTNDLDVVVDLPADRVADFCAQFPPEDFYLDEEAVRRALRARGQFNIVHPRSGLKIDVMIPGDSAFDRSRFRRGVRVRPAADFTASFASPEDVIVKKMEFYRAGGSDKHLRDIAGVLRVSGDRIDRRYIEEWADRFGLTGIWAGIVERLGTAGERP
jgi:hypothetical protein